jgi:hypothetical protein
MGFGDRFKDLARQAKGAVAEHSEQLQGAVEAAGVAADQKTRGKHSATIAKYGRKASDAIEKIAAGAALAGAAPAGAEAGSAETQGPVGAAEPETRGGA